MYEQVLKDIEEIKNLAEKIRTIAQKYAEMDPLFYDIYYDTLTIMSAVRMLKEEIERKSFEEKELEKYRSAVFP